MPTSFQPPHNRDRQSPNNRDRCRVLSGEQIADYGRLGLYAVITAATVWFLMQLPGLAAAAARGQAVQAAAMERQNRSMCEKWGLRRGTHEHTLCTIDLQELRRQDETRTDATSATMLF